MGYVSEFICWCWLSVGGMVIFIPNIVSSELILNKTVIGVIRKVRVN